MMILHRSLSLAMALLVLASAGLGPSSARAQNLTQRLRVNDLQGGYTVAGVGIRTNPGPIGIAVADVPSGNAVKCALLYWDVLGGPQPPLSGEVVMFAGSTVQGALIGSGGSPNQPQPNNYSYMADVSGYVNIDGNGVYWFSGYPTSGDPSGIPATEGVSLLVIYGKRDPARNQDLLIYDGNATLNMNGAASNTLFTGFNAPSSVTGASAAFIVGDGEPALGDTVYVNGMLVASNLFQGADPPGSGSYWDSQKIADVSTFIASGSTAATVTVQDDGDGLIWVAGALAVDSPFPDADVHIQPLTNLVPRGSQFKAEISALAHTATPVAVTGQVEVLDDRGHLLGLFAGPVNGRLRPGDLQTRNIRRMIPSSGLPARLIGVPITVRAVLYQQGTSVVIDDDFCRFVIQ